ncbi:STAS/SEC14 domain-containing protein [Aeromonas sobria]
MHGGKGMKRRQHGLILGLARVGDVSFISIKAVGRLSHEDYLAITPMLEAALNRVEGQGVRVLLDARELEGWELRAAWDDLKLGLKHGHAFGKIALYGQPGWQGLAARVGGWFISGEVRAFEEECAAIDWLTQ